MPFWSHILLPQPPRHPQNTLWNTPLEIFSSEYVLVWVQEHNRASIWTFKGFAISFPVGGQILHFLVTLGSFWTTFLRSSNLWGHSGTPILTSRSIVTLTAPHSLPPAQSESLIQIWDSSSTHTPTDFFRDRKILIWDGFEFSRIFSFLTCTILT